MFRLDEDRVVDATLSGGLARYINHSCNPNCVTEIVEVDREFRIIIFAKRRINRGEEVSFLHFDYIRKQCEHVSNSRLNDFFQLFSFSCRMTINLTSKMTRIKFHVCAEHQIVGNG